MVWFGEIPPRWTASGALVEADLFVSIGTSGAVYPAAGFVQARRRARTLELNLDPSEGTGLFDEARHGPAASWYRRGSTSCSIPIRALGDELAGLPGDIGQDIHGVLVTARIPEVAVGRDHVERVGPTGRTDSSRLPPLGSTPFTPAAGEDLAGPVGALGSGHDAEYGRAPAPA